MATRRAFLTLLLVVCTGCGRSSSNMVELQRARSGDTEVVLLASGALAQTRNYCTLEFRSGPDGHLVDVGTIKVRPAMTMEGAPMEGVVTEPRRVAPGRYELQIVLAMSGDWRITVEWDGPAGSGTVTFSAAVNG